MFDERYTIVVYLFFLVAYKTIHVFDTGLATDRKVSTIIKLCNIDTIGQTQYVAVYTKLHTIY